MGQVELTAPQGYAAARELHARRLSEGWMPIGRKIGFTNRTIWPRYGVYEPIWGTVYDRTLETHPQAFSLHGLVQPRIEPEICFGLKAAPPVTRDPARLLESIEWIAHSIEIVQCQQPGWKTTLGQCCADNGLHGRLFVGPRFPVSGFPLLETVLPRVEVVLKRHGKEMDRGVGSYVLDSPLLAFAYFVDVLSKQPGAQPLRAGEIVTTGTLTDAHPVAAGEDWETEIHGIALPGAKIHFE